jgi:hypothetical protein
LICVLQPDLESGDASSFRVREYLVHLRQQSTFGSNHVVYVSRYLRTLQESSYPKSQMASGDYFFHDEIENEKQE